MSSGSYQGVLRKLDSSAVRAVNTTTFLAQRAGGQARQGRQGRHPRWKSEVRGLNCTYGQVGDVPDEGRGDGISPRPEWIAEQKTATRISN